MSDATHVESTGDHWAARRSQLSLEEVSLLCQEITALSRAGVPLDLGLREMAKDLPKRLAQHSQEIGDRLASGESLGHIISDKNADMPPMYKAIVDAGIRSGELTSALESFSTLNKQLLETRRTVTSSLLYPFVLMLLLTAMGFLLMLNFNALLETFEEFKLAEPTGFVLFARWLMKLGKWLWILPATIAGLMAGWWLITCRGAAAEPSRMALFMNWVPGVRTLFRYSYLSNFTHILRLLILHETPMHEAISIAGAASGDHRLSHECRELSEQLKLGQRPTERKTASPHGIPPLLRWSLLREQSPVLLLHTLERTQQTYERRLRWSAEWLRVYLPMFFTITIGGTMTFLYATSVLGNFYGLIRAVSDF